MAKSKTRKAVVRKAAKSAPKKAMKTAAKKATGKIAKAAAKKKSSAPMMAADVKLAITTPVRVGPRRQLSLFPREIPPYRG